MVVIVGVVIGVFGVGCVVFVLIVVVVGVRIVVVLVCYCVVLGSIFILTLGCSSYFFFKMQEEIFVKVFLK